ncbi:hypothetical protein EPUL_005424, partial [Erysiphe pulchra]
MTGRSNCDPSAASIGSTLAIFEDEIGKEEASAFKVYLGLAIAKFAAADSSSTPPQILSHTHPNKVNGQGLGKGKNFAKNIAVATPRVMKSTALNVGNVKEALRLSEISEIGEKTWATVARNGSKKNRITLSNKAQAAPLSAKISLDGRLFVRLPQDHEWRKLYPAGIREIIVQKLAISPSLFGKIKPVHSGFALSPCSTEARETILKVGNGLFLLEAKLEPATNWIPVMIPTAPASIRKAQGEIEVSNSILIDDVEWVCSVRPAHVELYGENKAEAPHRIWMVYFSKAPRAGFRIFDKSGITRPFKKQQPLEFCKRCNGHHPTKNCSRGPWCGNCGSNNHSEEVCAPTKEQMKTFRQVGEREYQAVLRAKAAEESAASAENIKIDLVKN